MTDPQEYGAIGASILHLISSCPPSPTTKKPLAPSMTTKAPPCLLLPDQIPAPRMIVLNGPKKSGRTSIAMDLAYSCACNFVCQECVDAAGCQCVGAVFFRSTTQMEAEFPVTCHMVPVEDDTQDFSTRYTNIHDRTHGKNACFNPTVLKRIRVVYVSSIRDILFELLSLLGKPVSLQSCRCVIIDDLDLIASSETSPTSSMIQTLAVAIETSNTITSLYGVQSMVLATTEARIVAPWIDVPATLTEARRPTSSHQGISDFALSVSHWSLKFPLKDGTLEQSDVVINYSVTTTMGGDFRIYWSKKRS